MDVKTTAQHLFLEHWEADFLQELEHLWLSMGTWKVASVETYESGTKILTIVCTLKQEPVKVSETPWHVKLQPLVDQKKLRQHINTLHFLCLQEVICSRVLAWTPLGGQTDLLNLSLPLLNLPLSLTLWVSSLWPSCLKMIRPATSGPILTMMLFPAPLQFLAYLALPRFDKRHVTEMLGPVRIPSQFGLDNNLTRQRRVR